jgi:hypothetical protein
VTKEQKMALMAGAGLLGGVALVKFKQSESTMGQVFDFALGAAAGGSVVLLADAIMSTPEEALLNPMINPLAIITSKDGMGRTPRKATNLLSKLPENLFDDFKGNGVKIAPIPANPAVVNQDAS